MVSLETDLAHYKRVAQELFLLGVAAANPTQAVVEKLTQLHKQSPEKFSRTHIVGVGKAASNMVQGAVGVLDDDNIIGMPVIVTNAENSEAINGSTVLVAGHPVPDEDGLYATSKVAEIAQQLGANDTLLMLVSGGASAMLPMPVEGISLGDKIAVTNALLGAGVNINEMNLVRKQLSQIKGGGLVKMASPAKVVALILSDVIGDDPGAIASGPTVMENKNHEAAINIMGAVNILGDIPNTVKSQLEGAASENSDIDVDVENYIIGSNSKSIQAMSAGATNLDMAVEELEAAICGEAKLEADRLARMVKEIFDQKENKNPLIISAGGETTVTLTGQGKGGRNQELALAFAIAAELYDVPARWVFLSGGTDGRDGPTDAAGAIVDPWTLSRIRGAGHKARVHLNDNDAYHALEISDDLLITGGTGTNVADLQLLILC